jgi:hypothetical protein
MSSISCPGKKSEKGENTAPFIKGAGIIPENPTLGSRVTLRIEAGDKEGDNITYLVKWFLNGREIGEGLEFTLENAKRDDKIFAEVTPYDGKLNGATERTATHRPRSFRQGSSLTRFCRRPERYPSSAKDSTPTAIRFSTSATGHWTIKKSPIPRRH